MFHQGKNIDIYVKKILSFNQLNFITETKKKSKGKRKIKTHKPNKPSKEESKMTKH